MQKAFELLLCGKDSWKQIYFLTGIDLLGSFSSTVLLPLMTKPLFSFHRMTEPPVSSAVIPRQVRQAISKTGISLFMDQYVDNFSDK